MSTLHSQIGSKSSDDERHEDAINILRNMTSDEYNCHYCITIHTTYENIQSIIQAHNNTDNQETIFFHLRMILNLFGTFNIIVVFLVFGVQ